MKIGIKLNINTKPNTDGLITRLKNIRSIGKKTIDQILLLADTETKLIEIASNNQDLLFKALRDNIADKIIKEFKNG
ncbi:hypothetical protein LCGC14_2418960 [marine sediment metagenome]|uniref:RNA polymerase alpha subunit C-terminal domain-containing protein n=1 Tax=marine sediment metagenome TaxID=412755 RepID=A0A0F9E2C4_9ZZZZ